jgi:predicted Zn-dependent protease
MNARRLDLVLTRYNGAMTATAKQQVRQLLDDMPDDVSFQDIQYRLYLQEKLDQALEDVRQGRVLDQDEVDRRLAKWLDG